MRTIKFRAKHQYEHNWVYGSLLTDAEDNYSIICTPECVIEPLYRVLVDEDTVGQFTGLYDVDGKEIYEGDILNFGNGNTHIFVVYWNESLCSFCLREYTRTGEFQGGCSLGEMLHLVSGVKVIGNIHDNPELLSYNTETI
jgi:uncharacterized phage protein (TIGR01671 family)